MSPAYRQLLVQVMRDRASGGLVVRINYYIVACIIAALALAYFLDEPRHAVIVALSLIGVLAFLWCGTFLKSAVQQNLPAYARLVPGLRRRLMRLTVILYSASTVLCAALGWFLFDHPGYGLVVGGLFSVYVWYAHRYSWLSFPMVAIMVGAIWATRHPLDALLALADGVGEPLVTVAGLALVAALGYLGLRVVFPQAGDQHWAWQKRIRQQQAFLTGAAVSAGSAGGVTRWLAWLGTSYASSLRADSRHGAHPGRQMLHVLGTSAHDGFFLVSTVSSTLFSVLLCLYLANHAERATFLGVLNVLEVITMANVVSYACAVIRSAVRFQTEQSLYCLTPAAPSPARFNRLLMGALMLRCLRLWLASALAVLLLDMVVLGQLQVRGAIYAMVMLTLPFAALLMRNYAVMPQRPNQMLAVTAIFGVMFVNMAVQMLGGDSSQPLLFWIGSVVAAATLVLLGWRWRRMMALPPLLPAGRFAL